MIPHPSAVRNQMVDVGKLQVFLAAAETENFSARRVDWV